MLLWKYGKKLTQVYKSPLLWEVGYGLWKSLLTSNLKLLPSALKTCHTRITKDIWSSKAKTHELCSVSTENAIQLLLVDVWIKIGKQTFHELVISLPCKVLTKALVQHPGFPPCLAGWEQFLVAIMLGHETNCALWGWKFCFRAGDTAAWRMNVRNVVCCALSSLSLDIYSDSASKLFIFFKQSILIIWFAPWHF